jgi:membrane protein DedA with SNARE-associated domain
VLLALWYVGLVVAIFVETAGDNMGYVLGRRFARPLLTRGGRFSQHRRKLLACGERFFTRHGAKAVFIGRWLPFARVTGAWLAGATRMRWRTFAPFNALGGVAWAASIGGTAYALGASGGRTLTIAGTIGLVLMVALGVRHWRTCGRNAPDRVDDQTRSASATQLRTLQPNTTGGTHAH